ncbi:hypothetical protein RZN22_11485 [Bacillaceae bacterium S4-13-58]
MITFTICIQWIGSPYTIPVCMKCGLIMDRDENGARNILHRTKEELYPSAS